MRAVEVRVRELAGLGNDAIGVDLMNKAFGPSGPLTDPSAVKGEQEGTARCSPAPTRYYATLWATAKSTTTIPKKQPKRSRQQAFSCESSIALKHGSQVPRLTSSQSQPRPVMPLDQES